MLALVTVFALLVQMLAPSLALAAGGPHEQVVCTGYGLKTIKMGDAAPARSAAAHGCDHCVCPPTAAQPPAMIAPAVFVAFARETRPEAIRADLPPPARAPPRPPGQGPPRSNA